MEIGLLSRKDRRDCKHNNSSNECNDALKIDKTDSKGRYIMKDYFTPSVGATFGQESAVDKVQLEFTTTTLQQLMAGRQLVMADMHSLNLSSQQRLRQLLIDYLTAKI